MIDVSHAFRILTRRPGVPAVIAALFALGVGLACGMWAVVDAALLRPLSYPDESRLAVVFESHPQRGLMAVAPANFLDWTARVHAFEDVAGLSMRDVSVATDGYAPQRVAATAVTERFFEVMGVAPAFGRGLTSTDFSEDARVALIGHHLWVRRVHDLAPRRFAGRRRYRARLGIAAQVALSLALLSVTAGLLTAFRELHTLARTQVVDDRATRAMEVSLPDARYQDESSTVRLFDELLAALAVHPEVRAAGAASYLPPEPPPGNVRFAIEGRDASTDAQTALAAAVSESAFRMLGIALVRGRLLDARDFVEAPFVCVVSEGLARRYWPSEDPVGHRISLVGVEIPTTIVGVVADIRQPLSAEPRAEAVLYVPYRQTPWPFMTIMVTPRHDAGRAVAAVRQALQRLDPALAIGPVAPLDDRRTAWLEPPRLRTRIVTLFGVTALFLTLVGLYARVAHDATTRAREFAIRQAVGARPADVVYGLARETAAVVGVGLAIGLGTLPVVSRLLARFVSDVPPVDPRLSVVVAGLLACGALACTYWPARRAGRANPADLLKAE